MILTYEQLPQYRQQVAMVDGGFDPLHIGHIEYFREAAKFNVPLLCNVAADTYVGTKHPPLLPEATRAAILDALEMITYTHVNYTSTVDVLRQLQPRYYVKGSDWRGRLPQEQIDACAELGIEIVYLDTVRDSSTDLLKRYFQQHYGDWSAQAASLEAFMLEQEAVPAARYDEEYFTGDWRAGDNNYLLETRRKIEGRNPELIRDVFQPQRVLDMGCGPGILMYLLHELGIESDGIDFSPQSRVLAPEAVRDHIIIGSVTETHVPDHTYDLVICREVLEHLTVRQVRQTIHTICRASSKYIYVTTRYHQQPANMVDVTTEFHVDPTHVSLLNKEFMRVLFLLEGCKSRPDLEARMDWMNKGRVLVFEKLA